MTTWRKGDLGRFLAESPKRPRFEVVGIKEKQVEVWYGGNRLSSFIPAETFRRDCINLWELQEIVPVLPSWVKAGSEFEFPAATIPLVRVRHAEITDPRQNNRVTEVATVDLTGHKLIIRHIRRDYASCLLKDMLVLVPLPTIAKQGVQRVTRWQRLMSDDEPFEVESDDDLFKDFC